MKMVYMYFVDEKSNYILSITHTTHVEQCCDWSASKQMKKYTPHKS